jgi:hypothetical protein
MASQVRQIAELARDPAQEAGLATELGRLRSPDRLGAWVCARGEAVKFCLRQAQAALTPQLGQVISSTCDWAKCHVRHLLAI